MASVNFTYKKNLKDFIRTANDIISINNSAKKDIQWLAVGVSQFDKVKYLSKNLSKVNIVAMYKYNFLKAAWEKGNKMRRNITRHAHILNMNGEPYRFKQ